MKKLSSYQKLKNKNEWLLEQIHKLVCQGEDVEGITAKVYWKLIFETDKMLFYGDSNDCSKYKGIINDDI